MYEFFQTSFQREKMSIKRYIKTCFEKTSFGSRFLCNVQLPSLQVKIFFERTDIKIIWSLSQMLVVGQRSQPESQGARKSHRARQLYFSYGFLANSRVLIVLNQVLIQESLNQNFLKEILAGKSLHLESRSDSRVPDSDLDAEYELVFS